MAKNKTVYLLGILLFLQTGCDEIVSLDHDKGKPYIVINSVLKAENDSILLQVALTHPAGSNRERIENAEATLFENGKEIGKFRRQSPGWYVLSRPVYPASTYCIQVNVPSYGIAWGETTVPAPIQEGRIEIAGPEHPYGRAQVDMYWTDDARIRNYYWIGSAYTDISPETAPPDQDTSTLVLHNAYYTRSPLPDPFNRVMDEGEEIPTSYEYLIRIEDSGLAGIRLHLPFESSAGAGRYKVFLLNADVHYDAFLKSSILNRENADTSEDLPLYFEPAYTYSNIHGGTGLIASYSNFEKIYIPTYESYFYPVPALPITK